MSNKIYSPKEAAIAVLAKAEELYKSSSLAKGDWAKIHSKLKREGYSEESADKIDGAIKAKLGKSEENPDEKQDAQLGEEVEHAVEDHESQNAGAEEKEAGMKGHIKLAKFMGRMEHKKSQKAKSAAPEMDKGESASQMSGKAGLNAVAETGHEQGINTKGNMGASQGISSAGAKIRSAAHSTPAQSAGLVAGAKEDHKTTLDQIHQMSKPKLPV